MLHPPTPRQPPLLWGVGRKERGISLSRNRIPDPENPLISLSKRPGIYMKFFPIREHMLLGGLIIVYKVETLSKILLFVTLQFLFPFFSQHLESALPNLAFLSLAFLSMGKPRSKEISHTIWPAWTALWWFYLRVMQWGRWRKILRKPWV